MLSSAFAFVAARALNGVNTALRAVAPSADAGGAEGAAHSRWHVALIAASVTEVRTRAPARAAVLSQNL